MFGVGQGSIHILLGKQHYTPGEKVTGKLKLNLSTPKKASALHIEFYGEAEKTISLAGVGKAKIPQRVHHVKKTLLSSEKIYFNNEEYAFELDIPNDAVPPAISSGLLLGALLELFSSSGKAQNFYVEATLDTPIEYNIRNRVQVKIVPEKM